MTRSHGVFTALALVICVDCVRTQPSALTDADRAAIKRVVDSTLAIANAPPPKNFAAYARSYYTEDAISMPSDAPALVGRPAIAANEARDSSAYTYRWQQVEVYGNHDLAYVRGRYWCSSDRVKPDSGKYLEIWRRQSAGSWRVARDIYNSDIPRPVTKAP